MLRLARRVISLNGGFQLRCGFATMNITFLGTASAQPSSTRNHSALALRYGTSVWLFDCGEATQHRIQKSSVKMGKIDKIFITHTHGDHIFGILPLLASRLNGAGGTADGVDDPRLTCATSQPPLEIYGPLGTRAYVRNGLTYTHTLLGAPYVVHELRFPSDPQEGDFTSLPIHTSESSTGRNLQQSDEGVWPEIYKDGSITVSAAPILHSVPCVGYVIQESSQPGRIDPKQYLPHFERTKTPKSKMRELQLGGFITLSDGTVLQGPERTPGRKVAILGDTFDPSQIAALAANADVLIHEATNAHLPGIDATTKPEDTYEIVETRTKSRGHSTPQMAGIFARTIGAKKLVLNHFSARYAGNVEQDAEAKSVMDAIGGLAEKEFGSPVVCAQDFLSFDIPLVR